MDEDNPWKDARPRSMAGGIRKIQAREIRWLQSEWDQAQQSLKRELRQQALTVVREFNSTIASGKPLLSSPLLRAALLSSYHWMHVFCPGCQTIKAIDLRVVPRPQEIALTAIASKLRCEQCRRLAAAPRIIKLSYRHDD